MTDWDGFFTSLLYGSGSYIGLTILIVLLVGLFLKWRDTVVVSSPILIYVGILYVTNALAPQAVLSFIAASFMILTYAHNKI
jgi:hypothetical protein